MEIPFNSQRDPSLTAGNTTTDLENALRSQIEKLTRHFEISPTLAETLAPNNNPYAVGDPTFDDIFRRILCKSKIGLISHYIKDFALCTTKLTGTAQAITNAWPLAPLGFSRVGGLADPGFNKDFAKEMARVGREGVAALSPLPEIANLNQLNYLILSDGLPEPLRAEELPSNSRVTQACRQLCGLDDSDPTVVTAGLILDTMRDGQLFDHSPENLNQRYEDWRTLSQIALVSQLLSITPALAAAGGQRFYDATQFFEDHLKDAAMLLNDDIYGKNELIKTFLAFLDRQHPDTPLGQELVTSLRIGAAGTHRRFLPDIAKFGTVFDVLQSEPPASLAELRRTTPSKWAFITKSRFPSAAASALETPQPDQAEPIPDATRLAELVERTANLAKRIEGFTRNVQDEPWTLSGTQRKKAGLENLARDITFGVADYARRPRLDPISPVWAHEITDVLHYVHHLALRKNQESAQRHFATILATQDELETSARELHAFAASHNLPEGSLPPIPNLRKPVDEIKQNWQVYAAAVREHWPQFAGADVAQRIQDFLFAELQPGDAAVTPTQP